MSNPIVLITVPTLEKPMAQLRADARLDIRQMTEPESADGKPLDWPLDEAARAQILFCSGHAPRNLAAMRNVKWIQIASAGYESFLPFDLPSLGIRLSNALGVFDTPIAEWNIAMMIALVRDLRGMIRKQDSGTWDPDARHQREIRGLTVGLWGYGGIGRETARLAKAMGMRVHVLARGAGGIKSRTTQYRVPGTGDPEGVLPDRVFAMEQKIDFLRSLDFLIVATPLTNATRGMIGAEELRALPRHAFLLNPARGPIIQEPVLLAALREGWIAGAALDTHYHYPMPPDHPLWRMPNVIMTPHISGSGGTPSYLGRVWDIVLQNVERYLSSRPLLNEVSPEQLRGA